MALKVKIRQSRLRLQPKKPIVPDDFLEKLYIVQHCTAGKGKCTFGLLI